MNDIRLEKMLELDADGIEFIPIFSNDNFVKIIESYTREEYEKVRYVPKTGYRFYKIVDGKKTYIE